MKLAIGFFAFGALLTAASGAGAQPPDSPPPPAPVYTAAEKPMSFGEQQLGAPRQALEISVGTGYTQGFGSLQSGVGFPSVATPGIGVDLGIGYRINPNLALLATGQYQDFTAQRSSSARGLAAGLAVQYHFLPTRRVDPWMEVGASYRLLWEEPFVGTTELTHGFELTRVRVGLDLRSNEAISFGPVVGAGADVFLFQDIPGAQTNIPDPRLSMFIYAGFQGRFDIGRSTGTAAQVAQR
jgi:hypothetical protein